MESRLLFIYVETPLHAGSGRGMGSVDLPVQRERVTNYPIVQGSSLKGRLRAAIRQINNWDEGSDELAAIFGRAEGEGGSFAGAVSVGDARLLLFPVRSLAGVFAWVTSRDILARFVRAACHAKLNVEWTLPDEPAENECFTGSGSAVEISGNVTLEEFTYTVKADPACYELIDKIGDWLAKNALPQTDEYKYWITNLPAHLVVLPSADMRDFAMYSTEITTHVKLEPDTKTVKSGALWTVESLPADTLLYAPLAFTGSRAQLNDYRKTASDIEGLLKNFHHYRTQLGGDETTGRGMVMMRFLEETGVRL